MIEAENWKRWLQARDLRAALDALELAPERGDVRAWRRRHLGDADAILDARGAQDWIRKRSEGAARPIREVRMENPKWFSGVFPRYTSTHAHGSAAEIETLFEVAASLHEHFGWTVETAAGWLLTGSIPEIPKFEIRVEPASPKPDQRWRLITMKIPIEIPPSVVADAYRERWEQVSKGLPIARGTPISEKSLAACRFAVQRNDGRSWGEVFAEWNKARDKETEPDSWAFDSAQVLAAAVRLSYQRLTGRPLKWKRRRGERIKAGGAGDE